MVMMTKSDLVKQIDLSHVQSVIVGTAPITPALEGLMRGIMSNKKMKFRNGETAQYPINGIKPVSRTSYDILTLSMPFPDRVREF